MAAAVGEADALEVAPRHQPPQPRTPLVPGVSSSTATLPGPMSPAWDPLACPEQCPCQEWDSQTPGMALGQGEHPCVMKEHGEEGGDAQEGLRREIWGCASNRVSGNSRDGHRGGSAVPRAGWDPALRLLHPPASYKGVAVGSGAPCPFPCQKAAPCTPPPAPGHPLPVTMPFSLQHERARGL